MHAMAENMFPLIDSWTSSGAWELGPETRTRAAARPGQRYIECKFEPKHKRNDCNHDSNSRDFKWNYFHSSVIGYDHDGKTRELSVQYRMCVFCIIKPNKPRFTTKKTGGTDSFLTNWVREARVDLPFKSRKPTQRANTQTKQNHLFAALNANRTRLGDGDGVKAPKLLAKFTRAPTNERIERTWPKLLGVTWFDNIETVSTSFFRSPILWRKVEIKATLCVHMNHLLGSMKT